MYVDLFPGTVLRTASLDDSAALVQLDEKSPKRFGNPAWDKARWDRELAVHEVWVVDQQKSIVLAVVGYIEKDVAKALMLVGSSSGHVFFSRLIQHSLPELLSRGVTVVKTRCSKEMVPFYKQRGFAVTGELPNYLGVNISAFCIEKKIA